MKMLSILSPSHRKDEECACAMQHQHWQISNWLFLCFSMLNNNVSLFKTALFSRKMLWICNSLGYHQRAQSARVWDCCRLAYSPCWIIILALSAPYLVPTCFKILHPTATAARLSADYWQECRRLMCLLQMPFENIGSVSTVESNYFFAKPN